MGQLGAVLPVGYLHAFLALLGHVQFPRGVMVVLNLMVVAVVDVSHQGEHQLSFQVVVGIVTVKSLDGLY